MSWGATHEQDDGRTVDDDRSPVLDQAGREQLRGVLGLPKDDDAAVHSSRFPAVMAEPPLRGRGLVHDELSPAEWYGHRLAAEITELSRGLAEVNERLRRIEHNDRSRALAELDRKLEKLSDTTRLVDEVREQVELLRGNTFD